MGRDLYACFLPGSINIAASQIYVPAGKGHLYTVTTFIGIHNMHISLI